MERTPVKSSLIKSVGYDAADRKMEVEFAKGDLYHYHDVAPETHSALISSDSIGKFFGANIRGKFKHSKVEVPSEKKTENKDA